MLRGRRAVILGAFDIYAGGHTDDRLEGRFAMKEKDFDFRVFLKEIGITEAEYARLSGHSANTIHRRGRGDIGLPREVELLARCLLRTRSTADRLRREGGAMSGRQRR